MLIAASQLLNVLCTILYNTVNMRLAASITGCQFWELIGCLSVTFGGAPGCNVDDSLDSAYLGMVNGMYSPAKLFGFTQQ